MIAVKSAKSHGERAGAKAAITLGFVADPVARWVWPDSDIYARAMPDFVTAFCGRAFDEGTADMTACGGAAACWLPPDFFPDDEAVMTVIAGSVPDDRMDAIEDFFAQMDEAHPETPCWYLPQIAADPFRQGRGLGSALLKHRLRLCDADGAAAYLESSNSKNNPLYERHGFELMGEIQTGDSPVMYPMLRMPRG
ncbi:GNAT family N-acetyltransferase [Parasphingopyxis algicola]|nr:GNAT family N-acetyltransferase [Parasphingopyxis algicola]